MAGQGWGNPDFGGTALRLAAMRSPNYVAGSQGWTINQDGSVEFNNGTFRGVVTAGTFEGTNFVINSSGAFFYSGTPALGNLICSISNAAGTDAEGNGYVSGVGTYDNTLDLFAQLAGAGLQVGVISAHVPDTTDAGFLQSTINGITQSIGMGSPVNVTLTDPALWVLRSGQINLTTGQAGIPTAQLFDSTSVSEVDALISGSWRKTDISGTALTLQTPSYGTNWGDSTTFNGSANWGPLRFRLDTENNLHIGGGFKAGGTLPGAAVCNLSAGPPNYRPSAQYPLIAARNNGGTITNFMMALTTAGNLDVITQTGGGIAINNEYLIPPQVIPLGKLP